MLARNEYVLGRWKTLSTKHGVEPVVLLFAQTLQSIRVSQISNSLQKFLSGLE